uniref:Uncharacterized protein n=1 Tax=Brassica oleracea var. oleracea TaxID=109376 RepID=A0A0D3CGA2_BRAOL
MVGELPRFLVVHQHNPIQRGPSSILRWLWKSLLLHRLNSFSAFLQVQQSQIKFVNQGFIGF